MRKLSDVLQEAVLKSPFFQSGMARGLFNLRALASYIKPSLETQLQKNVTVEAISMGLSRLQRTQQKLVLPPERIHLKSITLHHHLSIFSYPNTSQVIAALTRFQKEMATKESYISLTTGQREVTVVCESLQNALLKEYVGERALDMHEDISGVRVSFDGKYTKTHGLLFLLMEPLVFQNVVIVEMASTYTEVVFYVHAREAQVAFSLLQERFLGDILL